jgi:hypothetical protein
MSMYSRLKYLFTEGFDVCSIMGYDARNDEELGSGKIIYRLCDESKNWRICSESFEVSHDEMQACSAYYLRRIFN